MALDNDVRLGSSFDSLPERAYIVIGVGEAEAQEGAELRWACSVFDQSMFDQGAAELQLAFDDGVSFTANEGQPHLVQEVALVGDPWSLMLTSTNVRALLEATLAYAQNANLPELPSGVQLAPTPKRKTWSIPAHTGYTPEKRKPRVMAPERAGAASASQARDSEEERTVTLATIGMNFQADALPPLMRVARACGSGDDNGVLQSKVNAQHAQEVTELSKHEALPVQSMARFYAGALRRLLQLVVPLKWHPVVEGAAEKLVAAAAGADSLVKAARAQHTQLQEMCVTYQDKLEAKKEKEDKQAAEKVHRATTQALLQASHFRNVVSPAGRASSGGQRTGPAQGASQAQGPKGGPQPRLPLKSEGKCVDFALGRCNRGANCKWAHDLEAKAALAQQPSRPAADS